jgi:oxygen-independent coproporphyrinogen-3 oxidase
MEGYREALLKEIDAWSHLIGEEGRVLESLYLGGGTPSTMGGGEVAGMIEEVGRGFALQPGAEVTVEVNPATWSCEDYAAARDGGVNRFSVGVQSLDDGVLRLLTRAHDAGEAREAACHALRTGGTVSVDLLYALPAGGLESLLRTVDEVLTWRPHHLSVYALALEERAPLARRLRAGDISLPGEDEAADQFLEVLERLRAAGYRQYEISNFCLPGYHSRHNLAYWRREEYLGIGAGAHSLLGKCRFSNLVPVLGYMKRIRKGLLPVERCEILDAGEELEEEIMLGLRTSDGIPEGLLRNSVGYLEDLESMGLLLKRGGRVLLTPEGMLLSNAVIVGLLTQAKPVLDCQSPYWVR